MPSAWVLTRTGHRECVGGCAGSSGQVNHESAASTPALEFHARPLVDLPAASHRQEGARAPREACQRR